MDGRESAQAQDAPSSANTGSTEKHREPRARKARGGASGCPWGSRGSWTSKTHWSGRGSGTKTLCRLRQENEGARRQRQERNGTVARKRAPTGEGAMQDASGKIGTWRSRCAQRSYSGGLARRTPAARSRRGGRAQARSYIRCGSARNSEQGMDEPRQQRSDTIMREREPSAAPPESPPRVRAGLAPAASGADQVSINSTPSNPCDSVCASPPCASLIRRRTSLAESAWRSASS